MGVFILRRIGQGILVVLGVTLVVFVATRLVGDPVKVMLPLSATAEQRAAFEHQIGLDQPIATQFVTFLGDLATLDFGESLWQRRPAMEIVFERLPNTLMLIAAGLGLAILLSLPLGALAALRPGGIADRITVFVGLLGLSVPQFWLGLLLIMLFAVNLKVLPTSGFGTPAHLILPAITLAIPSLARLVMLVRSSIIDELNQQYVRTARAKG
ncbi:MAG: ABC transporter permease, partial [Bauldia sp.]|nr:ABC transporter permease [Bauldia sp.]